MAASSDFDIIERENERKRKRREEREREREGTRADTSSITFSNGGYTVMSDESIFGAPSGEGGGGGPKAPGRRGVLPWSG